MFKKLLISLINPSHTLVFVLLALTSCLGKKCCFQGTSDLLLRGIKNFVKLKLLQEYLSNKCGYLGAQ